MARKRHQPEGIIQHLRTVEIEQNKGLSLEEIGRKIGVTTVTLARWKQENLRLNRIVANQAIDIDILKVAASGNF